MILNEIKKISFVIPCYGSEKTIPLVIDDIKNIFKGKCEYEIICVNDYSKDNVYGVLLNIAEVDKNIKLINLSKNFGQHNATMCGLSFATGDVIITMDDDGQTKAQEAIKLIDGLDEQIDVVFAKYEKQKENLFRRFGHYMNTQMSYYLCDKPKDMETNSFRCMKKYVVREMLNYHNNYTYLSGLILRTTKNVKNVEIQHSERLYGKSGYSFYKLISLWFNGFTAFSIRPLRLATVFGFIFSIIGFILIMIIVIKKMFIKNVPIGYSSTMCLLIFIGGLIMVMLGIIGEYVGRIYMCISNTPQYIIKETKNV